MSDTLKLALRISAVDLFSGVLRRFRNEITGTGAAAKSVQRDYDNMVRHTATGLKSLAVGGYIYEKLKPAVGAAASLQGEMLKVESILQGSYPNAEKLAAAMDRVRKNAFAVSNDLKYPAQAVVEATAQLVQAGVPLDATLDRLDKHGRVQHGAAYMTELLAETKGVDPALMAQNIAKVAHSFGVPAGGYGDMIDSIAKASTLGSADITELFYNLNQSGAIAHNLGHMDVAQSSVLAQALAPLGGESPAAVKSLIDAMTGAQARGYKWQQRTGFNFFDKKGNFIGLDAGLQHIEKRIHGMTEKQQDFVLGRSFGGAALPALRLLMAVDQPGVKSYAQMEKDYASQPSLVQQNEKVSQGLDFQAEKFSSTNKNTLSALFDPLLEKLTLATKKASELSRDIGQSANDHPDLAKTASYGTAALALAAGGYGAWRLARAAGSGGRLLAKLGGRGAGLATGVAEGKLLQATAGVTPVFVTNFPAGLGSGVGGAVAAAEGAGTASIASRIAARLGAAGTGFAALGGGGATGAAIAGGGVALAGGAGYLAGHELSKHVIEGTRYGDAIGERIAHVAAFLGNKEAQEAIARMNKAQPALQKLEGSIHIQIDQDGRARVTKLQSNMPRVPLDVGPTMMLP